MTRRTQAAQAAIGDPMTTTPVMVRKTIWENDDTFTLTLDCAPLGEGYHFLPGQFNMVYVYGMGEAAISISSDPARPGARVFLQTREQRKCNRPRVRNEPAE